MNYKEYVTKYDVLYVNTANPMNSGLKTGEKVMVLDVTCTGDLVVCSFENEHMDYLSTRRAEISSFINTMRYKQHTLNRYCLEWSSEESDDLWLNNKLERLGL